MTRAGLEASSLCKPVHTGIQKYITELLHALGAQTDRNDRLQLEALYRYSRFDRRAGRALAAGVRNRWYVGGALPPARRYDLVHALDMRMPRAPRARKVTTVYDLAVLHEAHQFAGYTNDRFRNRKRDGYKRLIDQSEAVVAISESTRRDILETFEVDENRVRVIYPGIAERFFEAIPSETLAATQEKFELNHEGYFLFVGALTERKNAARLIDAYLASDCVEDIELVIAGSPEHRSESVAERLAESHIARRVRFLGYVEDDELPALYAGARAFLYPTLYEGFGLPIVESLACGTPVLIADRGAAPEAGGPYATQVDPFSVDAIRSGIETLAHVPSYDTEEAQLWARGFSWPAAAEAHLRLYHELLGSA